MNNLKKGLKSPILLSNGAIAVGKGFEPHYKYLLQNYKQYACKQQFIVYDKAKLEVTYYMHKLNTNTLTYINSYHYETVTKETSSKNENHPHANFNAQNQYDPLCQTNLKIIRSYIDKHPVQIYYKLLGYLQLSANKDDIKIFKGEVTIQELESNTYFNSALNHLRVSYLKINQLKIKTLERINKPTLQEQQDYLAAWRNLYLLKKRIPVQENLLANQFAQKLGQAVGLDQLLQGKYRKYCYALTELK